MVRQMVADSFPHSLFLLLRVSRFLAREGACGSERTPGIKNQNKLRSEVWYHVLGGRREQRLLFKIKIESGCWELP